jgi:tRNA threonylcarbamoyladenosine biosynthesis protein TsaE
VILHATTSSVEETRALAEAVSGLARPGDVVVLAGDLGAGKTAFVQGFGRGLGVTARITSPTFTLVHVYDDGRLPIHHLDVYRLDQLSEALDLGLAEMLDDGGVVLVEWGDAITPVLPHDLLEVRLTFGAGDDDRVLAFRPVGPGWAARLDPLAGVLGPWTAA